MTLYLIYIYKIEYVGANTIIIEITQRETE